MSEVEGTRGELAPADQVEEWLLTGGATVCLLLQVVGVGCLLLGSAWGPLGNRDPGPFGLLVMLLVYAGLLSCLTSLIAWFLYAIAWWSCLAWVGPARETYHAGVLATTPAYVVTLVLLASSERLGLEGVRVIPRASQGWTTFVTAFCLITLLALAWRGYRRA